MNERIKRLRKILCMTQEEFSDNIGLSRNFIAQVESGKKNPSDRTILDICRKFDVREEWLKTGSGKMWNNNDRYAHNLAKLTPTTNETIIRWVNAIAETHPDTLKEIEAFFKKILEIDE